MIEVAIDSREEVHPSKKVIVIEHMVFHQNISDIIMQIERKRKERNMVSYMIIKKRDRY